MTLYKRTSDDTYAPCTEGELIAAGDAARRRCAEVRRCLADELDRRSIECDETPDTGDEETGFGALMRRAAAELRHG
jgi:hypothetical protein